MVLPEAKARIRYGDRLTIASLAAIEKGLLEDGSVEVRVINDGTHGVDVNRFICVLDGGLNPIASDIKAALRVQSARGTPHFGLTVDVKGTHRLVVIRPED